MRQPLTHQPLTHQFRHLLNRQPLSSAADLIAELLGF
jgi:hypothetical protein